MGFSLGTPGLPFHQITEGLSMSLGEREKVIAFNLKEFYTGTPEDKIRHLLAGSLDYTAEITLVEQEGLFYKYKVTPTGGC